MYAFKSIGVKSPSNPQQILLASSLLKKHM